MQRAEEFVLLKLCRHDHKFPYIYFFFLLNLSYMKLINDHQNFYLWIIKICSNRWLRGRWWELSYLWRKPECSLWVHLGNNYGYQESILFLIKGTYCIEGRNGLLAALSPPPSTPVYLDCICDHPSLIQCKSLA